MVTPTKNNVTKAVKETRNLFNELTNNFSRGETNNIREKLYKKETVYNILKEKERKDGLTKKHKQVLKNIERYFENFKKDLEKLQKYQHNITYGLNYLFNEDSYEPTELKSAFDGSYIQYESRGDRDANLSLAEYLDIIRTYLREMIDDHKARGEWKIQLTMEINFVSVLGSTQFQAMHIKSNNIEIIIGNETNNINVDLFNSIFKKYQEGLETKMKGSSFIFYCVDLLYYHLHKVSLNRGGLYIDSPEFIKHKKSTINPQNNYDDDNECLRYTIIAAVKYAEINNNPERVSKLRPFINN